jgi:hypothetical protein
MYPFLGGLQAEPAPSPVANAIAFVAAHYFRSGWFGAAVMTGEARM